MRELRSVDVRQVKVARKRATLLEQFSDLREKGYTRTEACREVGVSSSTVFRWAKAFNENGLVGLVDRMSARRGGSSIMSEDQKQFLREAIRNQARPNFRAIFRNEYLPFCRSLEQEPVSYWTLRRECYRIRKAERDQDLRDMREMERKLQQFKRKERTNG